jgi:outer membrane protein
LKKSSDFNFEDTKQITILLVRERYYNLLKAEKLLEVATETVRSSEESYKRAQVLFEVGKAPKSDVLQAKVQVETDRLSLIEAENDLSVAHASLNHVLGFDVDTEIKVVDNLDMPEMGVSYDDAMNNALEDHPSLNKRFYDLRAARAGVYMAVSSHLPSFYWFGGYTWRNRRFDQIKDFFDLDYNYYTGVQLSVPIFQGGSRIYTTTKASLDLKSSREALSQAQRDVALEVKQAYFLVQQSRRKINVTQDAIEAAEEDLRLNREKYSLGAGTMLDLIVAQVTYTTALSDHISAQYDYNYYVARLRKAMGKLEK